MTVLPCDTVEFSAEPIHRADICDLEFRFGVLAWFGFFTRRWWALDEGRLVEAATPSRLGEEIMSARRRGW